MALSPLKVPSHRQSRRRGGPSMAVLASGLGFAVLLLWMSWRFGFGLPARVHRAVDLARNGGADEALARLGALADSHPGDARILDAMGLALDRLGRPKDARADYAQALSLRLDPGAADLHCEEGRLALASGDWDVAAAEYDQASALDKQSAAALAGEGTVAMEQGHLPQALDLYKQALAIKPSLEEAVQGRMKAQEDLDRGSLYSMVDRNGEPLARQSVTAEGLGGLSYPRAQLAAHVVGYTSVKAGDAGLERDLKPLFPGCEVELTLDSRLQEAASHALGWRKGAIVALDPNTGEILCAVSQPSFQPEQVDKDWYKLRDDSNQPLFDRALDGLYEPGSIAKIMTAAAALETGVDMAKIFPMTPPTAINLGGQIFRDWEYHGEIRSLKEAMDVSSNIALYQVAEAMGPDVLLRTINAFGFNQPMDLGFTLANGTHIALQASRSFTPEQADSQFDLANLACGLGKGFRISPLQAARLAMVIANGGKLMKPNLVRSVHGLNGDVLYQMQPTVEDQVIKPDTAERVKQVMEDAVEGERGIGKRARVEGITIAGKTGTARTHTKGSLDAWFICFAPADKPKIAVAVFCDQEGTGMSVAAPIAGAFLSEALQ
ncbi:MAG TPA: penicillin-binding transpeptidase domain-containing protein [bacterium]|jgi:peptidoglycan glycosyltransferase|nr:penicillin-binding transpeptidase domain-containing protein [bacterium]